MLNKIGFYCWAGPGTIRMIDLKFFNPNINKKSLLGSYEYDYLKEVKEKFGITDFWATYSWGFSDNTEQGDREFLLKRINNFKKLDIRVHAYIQGTNLVYKEFPDIDWFCKDERGRLVTYYRGRKVVCVNNPEFNRYLKNKIENLYNKGLNGIFMDNVQMGQLGISPHVFAGCNCKFCNEKFNKKFGTDIATEFAKNKKLTKRYLKFRKNCLTDFLSEISKTVHKGKMQFGTNSYDPKLNLKFVLGADIHELDKFQDYLLFENYSLPTKKTNNSYIENISSDINNPIFVVSYKKGIGKDSEFYQNDMDNIYTEASKSAFYPNFKGSEYITNGTWHNLDIKKFRKLTINENLNIDSANPSKNIMGKIPENKLSNWLLRKYYNPSVTLFMENLYIRKMFNWLYWQALR